MGQVSEDDLAKESAYKWNLVEQIAMVMQPGNWDPKEKLSEQGREILKNMTRKRARAALSSIKDAIKPWQDVEGPHHQAKRKEKE